MTAPIGHKLIEGGWAGALLLPAGPARESAEHLYTQLFGELRIMAKVGEYVNNPARYRSHTVARVERARELGLKIQLSIDIHNSADSNTEYHQRREIPPHLTRVVRDIIRDADLQLANGDSYECINEPKFCRTAGPGDLPKTMHFKHYRDLFFEPFIEGARQANFSGLVLGWHDDPDHEPGNFERDSWIFSTDWGNCAEVSHNFVLDQRSTDPSIFYHQIRDSLGGGWRGHKYPHFENEHSSLGRQVHINSQLGARMCEASWNAYSSLNVPWGFLTVGGATRDFGNEGGWGMHTDLINDLGQYSLGAQALMRKAGVEIPDVGGGGGDWYLRGRYLNDLPDADQNRILDIAEFLYSKERIPSSGGRGPVDWKLRLGDLRWWIKNVERWGGHGNRRFIENIVGDRWPGGAP